MIIRHSSQRSVAIREDNSIYVVRHKSDSYQYVQAEEIDIVTLHARNILSLSLKRRGKGVIITHAASFVHRMLIVHLEEVGGEGSGDKGNKGGDGESAGTALGAGGSGGRATGRLRGDGASSVARVGGAGRGSGGGGGGRAGRRAAGSGTTASGRSAGRRASAGRLGHGTRLGGGSTSGTADTTGTTGTARGGGSSVRAGRRSAARGGVEAGGVTGSDRDGGSEVLGTGGVLDTEVDLGASGNVYGPGKLGLVLAVDKSLESGGAASVTVTGDDIADLSATCMVEYTYT